ncbi:collectin-10-like [Drosophila innubila]|uniref:collectin-10-like n=1 Tax=Drosophila innubila TaxID=198719 RepID=UPI00148B6339|nr:collectin-10-like [Drosophila innubila]
MKIILFGILVTILSVPEIIAHLSGLNLENGQITTRYSPNLDTVEPHPSAAGRVQEQFGKVEEKLISLDQKLEEKFANLDQKMVKKLDEMLAKLDQKLEEKGADLRNAMSTRKPVEIPKFQKIGVKSYYIDNTENVNWFVAVHKCREIGANLASLQSMEELKAVSENLIDKHYWLDVNDLGIKGVYKLLKSGQKAAFLHWHHWQPDNYENNEHCVELLNRDSNYAMNDRDCQFKCHFICEKDEQN